jgi:hypothetical protein
VRAAIDIDGTLMAWPRVLGPLTHALVAAGWDVVLLTGCSCAEPDKADRLAMVKWREDQVAPAGAAFREIVVCVGRNSAEVGGLKGAYCRDHGIDLFVDDSADYRKAARRLSPQTLVLGVEP